MKPLKTKMEKEYKLLPFDLNRYLKENRKLCTRSGKSVRILCTDLKNDIYKIVAAVSYTEGEFARMYTETGFIRKDEYETDDDLMMLPFLKEGWINIYATSLTEDCRVSSNKIYPTMKEALKNKKENWKSAIKIEWEE